MQLFQAEFLALFESRSSTKLILHETGRRARKSLKMSVIKRTAKYMTKTMIVTKFDTIIRHEND